MVASLSREHQLKLPRRLVLCMAVFSYFLLLLLREIKIETNDSTKAATLRIAKNNSTFVTSSHLASWLAHLTETPAERASRHASTLHAATRELS